MIHPVDLKWVKCVDGWLVAAIPSRRYTRVYVFVGKWGVEIMNDFYGQLGPRRLAIGVYWSSFWKYGVRFVWQDAPYPTPDHA